MNDICPLKHTKAGECRGINRSVTVKDKSGDDVEVLDLADYSRRHPPKGGVNFHRELNEAAKSTPRKWHMDVRRTGGKYAWELRGGVDW